MKKIILCLVIAVVLLSSGCISGKRPGLVPEKIEYHKGTEGLSVNLMKNLPPEEIWKLGEFVVGLELQNKGAPDIRDGIIRIGGFNPEYIMPSEAEERFDLAGKGPGYPEGEYKIMQFKFRNIAFAEGKDEMEETLKITAEYNYQTEASAVVCIDPDIYGLTKTVCEVREIGLTGGQGAPVAVTSVDETISPTNGELDVRFTISFSNKGRGKADNVHVDEVVLSGKILDCEQEDIILKEKIESRIKCSARVKKTMAAYTAPLIIRLSYKYIYSDYKTIKITR